MDLTGCYDDKPIGLSFVGQWTLATWMLVTCIVCKRDECDVHA